MKFLLELKSEIGTGWCIVFIWVEQQKKKKMKKGRKWCGKYEHDDHFRTLPGRLCGSSRGRHLRSCGNSLWNVANYHWNIVPCSAVNFISGRWHFLKTLMWMYINCAPAVLYNPLCSSHWALLLFVWLHLSVRYLCTSHSSVVGQWSTPFLYRALCWGGCARTCVGSCVTVSALALASMLHWQ